MIFNKQDNKDIRETVRDFFHSIMWKKTLTFLFFVALAFGFWLLQAFRQQFEITFSVPVKYTNVPKEVVLSNSNPEQVNIRVRDKGTSLLNYITRRKSGFELEIDMQRIDPAKTSYTVSKINLEALITKILLSTSTLLSINPDLLEIEYHPLAKKEIPILLNGTLSPASGYVLIDTLLFIPGSVWAYGSREMLDTISGIYTENIQIKNIRNPVSKVLKLQTPPGIELSESEIRLNVSAAEFTEKIISVPVICRNVPSNYSVRIFPSEVEVIFQVILSDYNRAGADDFEIAINYRDLLMNSDYTIPLILTRKPAWVDNYRLNPARVEFLIEQITGP